jgi:hypothetical protein
MTMRQERSEKSGVPEEIAETEKSIYKKPRLIKIEDKVRWAAGISSGGFNSMPG